MEHYRQRLLLSASPETVYQALATQRGLRGWWTEDCDAGAEVGQRASFRFGRHHKAMRIEALVPGREVRWHCVEAHLEVPGLARPDEWVGTQIVFNLSAHGAAGTALDFEHIGLTPELGCYGLCQEGWQQYLASLQVLVETGRGAPYVPAAAACGSNAAAASCVTDRIERQVHIQAPRSRVWRAISNAEEYGRWFGANLQGQVFAPGQRARGPITIAGYEHVMFDVIVERVEPEQLLAFRWHPYAVDAAVDYSKEERTLVTFTLHDAGGGTLLKVVESGFDKVPPGRRMEAFRMNSGGWEGQLRNIERHLTSQP